MFKAIRPKLATVGALISSTFIVAACGGGSASDVGATSADADGNKVALARKSPGGGTAFRAAVPPPGAMPRAMSRRAFGPQKTNLKG